MEQLYIGIDMGGTKCAVVAGHADGKILRRIAFPSGKDAHPDEFLPRFYEAIDALLREYNGGAAPAAVGVSCGGPLDTRRGVIQAPPNLPLWDEVPICALLSERYGCPAYLPAPLRSGGSARGAEQGIWCSSRLAQGWARG